MAFQPVKRGRRIEAVKLIWATKSNAELIEAQRELDRPRVGRVARREGTVEAIAAERLRLAEALANAPQVGWASTDKISQHGPAGDPDRPEGKSYG